jgi:hypothetical protein
MKKIRKSIALLMTFILCFIPISTYAQPGNESKLHLDGYEFEVIVNSDYHASVSSNENGYLYVATYDKITKEINLEVSETNIFTRGVKEKVNLDITIDNYNPDEGVELAGVNLTDENGRTYNLNKMPRFAFAIPIGMAITASLIDILLGLLSAIVIAGVAYIVAEEAVSAIKNSKNKYQYYNAVLSNNAVYVGNGISRSVALGVVSANNAKIGVFATSSSYARVICGAKPRGPENHGSSSGYWYHYHNPTFSKTHVWYY